MGNITTIINEDERCILEMYIIKGRKEVITNLEEAMPYVDPDIKDLCENLLKKLGKMSDEDFDNLDLP